MAKAKPKEDTPLVAGSSSDDDAPLPPFSLRELMRYCGPGLMMSLAYIDPGNLEVRRRAIRFSPDPPPSPDSPLSHARPTTRAQAEVQLGAYTGARLIWVLWWATVIGAMLQELAARIGMVSGADLAHAVRARYPRWVTWTVYVNLELAIMGADLQDLLGTAQACKLLFGWPLWLGTVLNSALSMALLYVYEARRSYVELMIGLTLVTVCICFFWNAARAQPDGVELIEGLVVPGMQPWAALPALGTVGAVIMPHNLFLHSTVVLSRRADGDPGAYAMRQALYYTRIETVLALLVTFAINLAVVATFWALFYEPACIIDAVAEGGEDGHSFVDIDARACVPRGLFFRHNDSLAADGEVAEACVVPATGEAGICSELELGDAGHALGAVLGRGSMLMWGVGVFVAGQASVLATTYAGQAIMDGCLRVQLPAMTRVLLARLVSIGPAVAVALWTEWAVEAAAKAQLMQWINAFQACQLPFAMLPTLHFVADRATLGRFRARGAWLALCWLVALALIAANVVLVASFVIEWAHDHGWPVCIFALTYAVFYFAACVHLVMAELEAIGRGARAGCLQLRGASAMGGGGSGGGAGGAGGGGGGGGGGGDAGAGPLLPAADAPGDAKPAAV